jgi:hypothetical protein
MATRPTLEEMNQTIARLEQARNMLYGPPRLTVEKVALLREFERERNYSGSNWWKSIKCPVCGAHCGGKAGLEKHVSAEHE